MGREDDGKSAEQKREEEIARTTRMIREAVLWFLRRGLEYVTSVQGRMVERRIERVKEKEKSVLYKSSATAMRSPVPESPAGGGAGTGGAGAGMVNDAAALSENEVAAIEAQLSPEQLQLFAEENDSMLRHYEDTLNKVQYVPSPYCIPQHPTPIHAPIIPCNSFLISQSNATQRNATQYNTNLLILILQERRKIPPRNRLPPTNPHNPPLHARRIHHPTRHRCLQHAD